MTTRINNNAETQIAGNQTTQVEGNRIDVVTGSSDERVSGTLVTRIEGRERRCVEENADLAYCEDLTIRVEGCLTTLVGKADNKRSWVTHAEGTAKLSSLDTTEIASEGELVLRVGKSSIRITSEKIEAHLPGDHRQGRRRRPRGRRRRNGPLLEGRRPAHRREKAGDHDQGRSLSRPGKRGQDRWQKDPPELPGAGERPAAQEPEPPTGVELTDEEGNPLAYQRFLVIMDDGSEVSGMTDKDGKAELDLTSGGKVVFPDLTELEAG